MNPKTELNDMVNEVLELDIKTLEYILKMIQKDREYNLVMKETSRKEREIVIYLSKIHAIDKISVDIKSLIHIIKTEKRF